MPLVQPADAQSSDYLTVGTPDSNGKPADSAGRLGLKAVGESPIDPDNGDQADVEVTVRLNDVRNQGRPVRLHRRVACSARAPDHRPLQRRPRSRRPATVADTPLAVNVACSATAGCEGGACNVATTADAVLAGVVQGG